MVVLLHVVAEGLQLLQYIFMRLFRGQIEPLALCLELLESHRVPDFGHIADITAEDILWIRWLLLTVFVVLLDLLPFHMLLLAISDYLCFEPLEVGVHLLSDFR